MNALSTAEVAAYLGTTPAAVWQLVRRGRISPVLGSRNPLWFRFDEVERVRVARMTAAEHARLDDLATRWERSCP